LNVALQFLLCADDVNKLDENISDIKYMQSKVRTCLYAFTRTQDKIII